MRQNAFNVVFFVLLAAVFTGLFWYAEKNWLPKADRGKKAADELAGKLKDGDTKPPERPTPETIAAVTGGASAGVAALPPPPKPKPEGKPEVKPPSPPPPKPEPGTLIALGGKNSYLDVLLNTHGGGVQLVKMTRFREADRLGRSVTLAGQPATLCLIPGIVQHRNESNLRDPLPYPDLSPGKAPDPNDPNTPESRRLNDPSYTVFLYPTAKDKYPDPFLGETNWRVASEEHPDGGEHKVVFETELGDPYFVLIRKTYTLGPKDYHIGLKIDFVAKAGRQKGRGEIRYQLSGPRGMPIEGEWYTSTYRVALVGWDDKRGTPRRQYEDAMTVSARRGGDVVQRLDSAYKYAAIMTQFFASAMCPDDRADGSGRYWEYVRATSELPLLPSPEQMKEAEDAVRERPDDQVAAKHLEFLRERTRVLLDRKQPQFDDITVRAVSEPLDLAPNQTVTHSYLLYNGPAKVRLLGLLRGDDAVDPELVNRYTEALGLKTITDFRSPTALGAFADAIYWTDLVIVFTNLMHWLLAVIHYAVPNWALCIVVLTVIVRLILLVPSKKQTQMNMKMMAMQEKLKPELDKLHEKYKDDFHAYNQAKTRLMMQHGVNPFSAMGGCLLLFAQMPIMMGLYYCLQESIFFRLEPFLWAENLSAPDMLAWWSEKIPYVSTPADIGSMFYLGPYLNILPIIAVGLMIYQQNKMMPPPTDEQMAAQQRMMKFMMILVAVMFYKVAAGLALYFIVTTLWGVIERRLIPKARDKGDDSGSGAKLPPKGGSPNGSAAEPRAKGLLGRLREAMQKKMEQLQKQAEEQAARQVRTPDRNEPIRNPDRRDGGKDRKKKRRK